MASITEALEPIQISAMDRRQNTSDIFDAKSAWVGVSRISEAGERGREKMREAYALSLAPNYIPIALLDDATCRARYTGCRTSTHDRTNVFQRDDFVCSHIVRRFFSRPLVPAARNSKYERILMRTDANSLDITPLPTQASFGFSQTRADPGDGRVTSKTSRNMTSPGDFDLAASPLATV